MRILEMQKGDLARVVDTIEALPYTLKIDPAWLRYRTLDDPSSPGDLLLLAEIDGEIAGFCFGCVRNKGGLITLFGVKPEYRRRGIATALFAEIESRLSARRVAEILVGGLGPKYFDPGVLVTSTEALSFLLHRGYQTDRISRVDMEVDLTDGDLETSEAEERLASMGIVARRAAQSEVAAAARFAKETFSEGWRFEVSRAAHSDPVPLFIALDKDRIVSFAAYDVTGPALFGPTGTHPEYRRRGIGGILLKMCLRSLRQRGETVAEIMWVGPIGFYARAVDARVHKVYWLFTKSLRDEAAIE